MGTIQIVSRYKGPVGFTGSRIVATATAKGYRRSLTVPYDHSLGFAERHEAAARALMAKLQLDGELTYTGTSNDGASFYRVTT